MRFPRSSVLRPCRQTSVTAVDVKPAAFGAPLPGVYRQPRHMRCIQGRGRGRAASLLLRPRPATPRPRDGVRRRPPADPSLPSFRVLATECLSAGTRTRAQLRCPPFRPSTTCHRQSPGPSPCRPPRLHPSILALTSGPRRARPTPPTESPAVSLSICPSLCPARGAPSTITVRKTP
jgi:hypothetical protein